MPQSLQQLFVVIRESTFENSVNVMVSTVETLLDHVGRELQLGQTNEVLGNLFKDQLVSALVAKLEDVLDQVVAIWIFDEVVHLLYDVVGKLEFLVSCALFEASLHYATAMFVHADLHNVLHASLEYELCILRCYLAS
mgnify:CR=1 FL=1